MLRLDGRIMQIPICSSKVRITTRFLRFPIFNTIIVQTYQVRPPRLPPRLRLWLLLLVGIVSEVSRLFMAVFLRDVSLLYCMTPKSRENLLAEFRFVATAIRRASDKEGST